MLFKLRMWSQIALVVVVVAAAHRNNSFWGAGDL
jgi:molybdopterin synthase catalytic subunit